MAAPRFVGFKLFSGILIAPKGSHQEPREAVFSGSGSHERSHLIFWIQQIYYQQSVILAQKTSKSQVGADLCCGWENFPIYLHGEK